MNESYGRWMWATVNRFGRVMYVRDKRREAMDATIAALAPLPWRKLREEFGIRTMKVQVIPEGQDRVLERCEEPTISG